MLPTHRDVALVPTDLDLFAGKKEIALPEKEPAIIELTGNEDPEHFTLAVNSAYRKTPVLLEITNP